MNKNAVETNKVNELVELDKQHFIHPSTNPHELVAKGPGIIFSEGKGIYVKNMMDGKEYIDGMSMLWNVNIGHGQEEVVDAGKEQMSKIAYSSAFKGFSNEPAIKLAKKISGPCPRRFKCRIFHFGRIRIQ